MVDEAVIEVLATKMGVTSGGLALEDTLLDSEEQNIESPFPEIEDEDVALGLGLLVETVCDGGGGGLVDDTEHLETGDGTGVLGGLALSVVEVYRVS